MTQPTSVLHARVVSNTGGGPDKTIMRSAAYLPRERYNVAACYLHPAGNTGIARLVDQAHAHGMPMHTIPERGAVDRRALHHLVDLCKRRRIDIWHSHDYKTDVLGLMVRRQLPGLKLVSTVHGFTRENLKTRFYARLNDVALRGYDRVFAVSPALVKHCAMRGVHPGRLSYLPNAIELERYPQRSTKDQWNSRKTLGLVGEGPAIGVVGRLSREKGVDRALRIFAALRETSSDATLHLIGDGPERGRLSELAQELGIKEAVTFHAWCEDAADRLKAMDVMLSTSHTEGMPNALLEAMALGVPVAATPVGGVPEMLADGDAGLLLTGDDEAAWAGQLEPLFAPSPMRSLRVMRARDRVESLYSFDARMERVRATYERLCPAVTTTPNAYGLVA